MKKELRRPWPNLIYLAIYIWREWGKLRKTTGRPVSWPRLEPGVFRTRNTSAVNRTVMVDCLYNRPGMGSNRRKIFLFSLTLYSFFPCTLYIFPPFVGLATGYMLDVREIGVRVPVGARFFSSPRLPDRLWGLPSLLSNGYRGLFPRWQIGRSVKQTTHLQLVPRSRTRGSIHPSTPPYILLAKCLIS
jgi:hypothetical protein